MLLGLAMAASVAARAAVVYSNLNASGSATVGSGFTNYAQRFTTVSAGSGFQLDLNLVSLSGTRAYSIELWSADVAGTQVNSLLAAIGSGSVSSTDKTAVTTFNSSYALAAATNYFIKITADTGSFGAVLGPSSNTALNSVTRYGVGNLNNQSAGDALAMRVEVAAGAAVPDAPSRWITGLGASLGVAAMALRSRRLPSRRAAPGITR
jgi:hypothetical protein